MKAFIYDTGVGKCHLVAQAMARGTGFPVAPPAPLLPGAVIMYGCLRGLRPTLGQAQDEGRLWIYADNGYFRPGRAGYFRITRNALQHDGTGDAGSERWKRLGLDIKPWRERGSHILVCPPGALFGELWGIDHKGWLARTLCELEMHTDRPIRVRPKPPSKARVRARPLMMDLKDAWALVTYASNTAVEALLAGVPVFCTAACAAYRMGTSDLARIEDPVMPDDRERWARVLAANQWTLAEMANGLCWRELQAR